MDEKDLEKKEDTLDENTTEGGTSNEDQEDSNQMQPMQEDEEEDSEFDALEDAVVNSSAFKASTGGGSNGEQEPEEPSKAEGVEENSEQEQEKKDGEDSEKLDKATEESAKDGIPAASSEKEEDGEKEVMDETNSELTNLMVKVKDNEAVTSEEGEGEDIYFDTLQELKNLREENAEKEKNDKDNKKKEQTPKSLKEQIMKYRNGNLYKAVVLAKHLEAGNSNPEQSSRTSRFFNSSTFNKTADVVKLVGLSSGTLGSFDSQYAGSAVSKGISLVSNFMIMVTSIRDFVKKIKGFKSIQGETKSERVFAKIFSIIGMVSDLSMALAKGCAIAKTIAGIAGKSGGMFTKIFTSKIMNYVSLFLTGTSQIGGLLNGSRGLMKAKGGLKDLSTAEGKTWNRVEPLEQKYQDKDAAEEDDKDEEDDGDKEYAEADDEPDNELPPSVVEKKQVENPAEKQVEGESAEKQVEGESAKKPEGGEPAAKPEGGEPDKKEDQGNPAQTKEERTRRRRVVDALLARDDLSDADKTKVMVYAAVSRKYENVHANLVKGAVGLAASAIGFGQSIITGVQYGVGTGNAKLNKLNKYAGIAASLGGIAASGTKMGVDKHTNDKRSSESSLMQAKLMGSIKGLQANEYGLKGLYNALDTPDASEEKKAQAKNAIAKYATTDAMFTGVGVKYGQLFKAPNLKAFQNLLMTDV